jgi:F-type H+-transporting ATPase subunit b
MSEILNILGSVGFNWHVALANFVNFLIILFLLNKFFFKKIGKILDERHNVIEHGLNQAREAELKLASAEEEKHTIIKSAHKEKETIVAHAESLARDLALSIESDAQEGINARIEKLKQEEVALATTVEKAFALRAPRLVTSLYAKTLMKELTAEENNALIARMNA